MSDIDLLAALRNALRIGAVSFDGDGWYAKDAGLVVDGDDGDAAFTAAFAALEAIAAGVTLDPRPAPDAALVVERLRHALHSADMIHPTMGDRGYCHCKDRAAAIAREYAALSDPVTSTDKQP